MPHPWVAVPARWIRRIPLPLTASVTALLLVAPALWLRSHPRPQARGLERVLSASALLQSFAADPRRPAPDLWVQRLGPDTARRLWNRQRGNWWQFWGRHGDGGLYLVLPADAFRVSGLAVPATALAVDDLRVFAPGPLAAQMLREPFALKQRQPRGLEGRCIVRLQSQQAVYWTDAALGQMFGPLSSLLQAFRQGCLELGSRSGALLWQGEASGSPGAPSAAAPEGAALNPLSLPPLGSDRLLEVRGNRLDLLLQDLLDRQLIREPLASRYGIGDRQLALLRRTPFLLRLRPQARGPFQASLELQLAVGDRRRDWANLLGPLRKALVDQGLGESSPQIRGAGSAAVLPSSTWSRDDGVVVGGWRWVSPAAASDPQLLFFLGPDPSTSFPAPSSPAPVAGTARWPDARPLAGVDFVLQVRPEALSRQGLLPSELPQVVQRAGQLALVGRSAESAKDPAESSSLSGSLRLASPVR